MPKSNTATVAATVRVTSESVGITETDKQATVFFPIKTAKRFGKSYCKLMRKHIRLERKVAKLIKKRIEALKAVALPVTFNDIATINDKYTPKFVKLSEKIDAINEAQLMLILEHRAKELVNLDNIPNDLVGINGEYLFALVEHGMLSTIRNQHNAINDKYAELVTESDLGESIDVFTSMIEDIVGIAVISRKVIKAGVLGKNKSKKALKLCAKHAEARDEYFVTMESRNETMNTIGEELRKVA